MQHNLHDEALAVLDQGKRRRQDTEDTATTQETYCEAAEELSAGGPCRALGIDTHTAISKQQNLQFPVVLCRGRPDLNPC